LGEKRTGCRLRLPHGAGQRWAGAAAAPQAMADLAQALSAVRQLHAGSPAHSLRPCGSPAFELPERGGGFCFFIPPQGAEARWAADSQTVGISGPQRPSLAENQQAAPSAGMAWR